MQQKKKRTGIEHAEQNRKRREQNGRTRCRNSYLFCSLTLSDLEERQNCLQDRAENEKGRGKSSQKYFQISPRFFSFPTKSDILDLKRKREMVSGSGLIRMKRKMRMVVNKKWRLNHEDKWIGKRKILRSHHW